MADRLPTIIAAGAGQCIGVGGRAQKVGLHGSAKAIGQATRRVVEHAREDDVRMSGFFGSNLHAATAGESLRDGCEAIGGSRRIGTQRQV